MLRKNTQSLAEVLQEFMSKNNLEAKIFEQRLLQAWPALLGEQIASYTNNLYIKNGVLYVNLSSSVVRNELMMCRTRLVQRLNEYVGTNVINNIIFR